MRIVLVATFLATAVVATAEDANAQRRYPEYPWCAQMANSIRDCRYVTLDQCRATVSGDGGNCERNLRYRGGPPPRQDKYLRPWFSF